MHEEPSLHSMVMVTSSARRAHAGGDRDPLARFRRGGARCRRATVHRAGTALGLRELPPLRGSR